MNKLVFFFVLFALAFNEAGAVVSIADYFGSIKTIQAKFIQHDSDDDTTEGYIWIEAPGRLRVEYYDPAMVITINKGLLAYHDVDLEETSHIFLEKNDPLLSLLLAPKKINEADIKYHLDSIYITKKHDDKNYVIIMDKNPMCIKSFVIEDVNNEKITLNFVDAVYNKPIAKKLFTEF